MTTDTDHKEVTRKLRWYFISATLDFVGLSICLSILPFLAQELGAAGIGVGMIFSVFSVGMALGGAIFGRLADACGRRYAVIVSTVATVVSYVLCGLAYTYWMLLAARFVSGLAAGSMAITNSVIIDLVPQPSQRPKYTGMLGACQGVAFFLGPALAALLSPLGFNATFFITAALSSIGLLGVCLFAEETQLREPATSTNSGAVANSVTTAQHQPEAAKWDVLVYVPMVVMFLASNNFAVMNSTHALLMQHNFSWGVVETGALMASVGALQIFIQAVVVKRVVRTLGAAGTLTVGCGFLTLGMALYPFMPSWQLSVAFFLVYMLAGFSLLLPVAPLVIADMVPKHDTGKAMGMNLSFFALGRISGPAIGGGLWDVSHAMPFWVGCAVTGVAMLLMSWLTVRLSCTKCEDGQPAKATAANEVVLAGCEGDEESTATESDLDIAADMDSPV